MSVGGHIMASIIFGDELNTFKNLFTLNRYAEDYYFGRSDIERWFAKEKKSEIPDMETWKHVLQLMNKPGGYSHFVKDGESLVSALLYVGFPISKHKKCTSEDVHFKDLIEWHRRIFGMTCNDFLNHESIMFPVNFAKGGILVLKPGIGKGGSYREDCLQTEIAESALFSWRFLDDERAEKAKEYLCNWLERCIEKVRSDAVVDFDMAVAVSEDGKKILHSDWVLLYDVTLKKNTLYKGDEFKEEKVVRDNFFSRYDTTSEILLSEDIIFKCIRSHDALSINYEVYTQTYFKFLNAKSGKEETCFFAQIDGEFPSGGKVV